MNKSLRERLLDASKILALAAVFLVSAALGLYLHVDLPAARRLVARNVEALLDGPRPLRPGSRVFLQVTVAGQTGGRTAHVLRCAVASLENQTGVQYRSAIVFDNHWESLWEHCTLRGYRMPMLLDHFEMVDGYFLPGGTEPLAPESEDGPR